ncbi:hypothetical protein [Oligoflexus tunisiensis]|uniref:hypothetical protein n=1 Tax=Oligoflexus tunisiensis TaxID=708132 RepID=UPI00114D10FE|nr:hypothetical protein [Oligoflexus tunisiensis]
MNALFVMVLILYYLTSPSRDHVRSDIDLYDRGRLDCQFSSMDGRKTRHGSSYHDDIDILYHSSDSVVSCQSLILAGIHRPFFLDLTLSRLDDFTEELRVQLQTRFAQQIKLWTVTVFHSNDSLHGKVLTAVKVALAEGSIPVAQQVPQIRLFSAEVPLLPEACALMDFKDRSIGYLLIVETNLKASTLQAAACTAEGWIWL